MNIFAKNIEVCIDKSDNFIALKLFINDNMISKMHCLLQDEETLLICDIMPFKNKGHYCKGYGSIMITKLFEYCLHNKITKVLGNLSIVDADHKDRLHGFYKKNGFEIIEYEKPIDTFYGLVIKKI